MTSTINVSAHVADDKVVAIFVGSVEKEDNEVVFLKDGETLERTFYDDMVVGAKEILKTQMGEFK